jgi:hypothetical protein
MISVCQLIFLIVFVCFELGMLSYKYEAHKIGLLYLVTSIIFRTIEIALFIYGQVWLILAYLLVGVSQILWQSEESFSFTIGAIGLYLVIYLSLFQFYQILG